MYWWRVQSIRYACTSSSFEWTFACSMAWLTSDTPFVYRKRRAVNYHDVVGPTALCGALLVAIIVNFSLRFKQLD